MKNQIVIPLSFEGNCNECLLQGKNPFLGKDGLFNLVYAAYRQYVDEVMVKGKLYRRYVEDFLNGHAHSIAHVTVGRTNTGKISASSKAYSKAAEIPWRIFGAKDISVKRTLRPCSRFTTLQTNQYPMSLKHRPYEMTLAT